jgi:hypothetical protein
MDAIIMPSITSLVAKLQADFPQFTFSGNDEFRWSPRNATIFYDQQSDDAASLFHEAAHALLHHSDYTRDVTLIEMESKAWEYAQQTLAPSYNFVIDQNESDDALDTYRDWLHARSTCPHCKATGLQTATHEYKCLACLAKWRVNDARSCALRRYKTAQNK